MKPSNIIQPQEGPQVALLSCPAQEIFYGGARGGGKSHGLILDWLGQYFDHPQHARGILVRKTYPELENIIDKCLEVFPKLGAQYAATAKTWHFIGGAKLKLRCLEGVTDAARYQGHEYCVQVDTPVYLGGGVYAPAKDIQPGWLVDTLEGEKRVSSTVQPYLAPCVRMSVYDSKGAFIASQIHPVWHPVCATAGLISRHSSRIRHTWNQFSQQIACHGVSAVEFPACEGQVSQGWFSYSEDGRNGCTGSSGGRRAIEPLHGSFFPVALHEPCLQSVRRQADFSPEASIFYRHVQGLARPLSVNRAIEIGQQMDRQPSSEPDLSTQDHANPYQTSDPLCAHDENCTVLDSLTDYPIEYRSHDEPVPVSPRNDLEIPQSQADAVAQCLDWLLDELDTIPTDSRHETGKYQHPYSGEGRRQSVGAAVGFAVLEPWGDHPVCDFTVEDANHYITEGGVVNSNSWLGTDEGGNWSDPAPLWMLKATLRNTHGIAPRMALTGNPGGVGQAWMKERYISGYRPYQLVTDEKDKNWLRTFIPAKLSDNKILLQSNPGYTDQLRQVGAPWLVKAWLEGNWDVVPGMFLEGVWDASRHVVEPFKIPSTWRRWRAMDWGFAKPYAIGWYAQDYDGNVYLYRELYGRGKGTNTGSREDAGVVAKRIKAIEAEEVSQGIDFLQNPADSACWMEDGRYKSVASIFHDEKVYWAKAAKGPGSRVNGAQEVIRRLNEGTFKVFSTCANFLRTVPSIPADEKHIEDVDTDAEDHHFDQMRYSLMSRQPKSLKPPADSRASEGTYDHLIDTTQPKRPPASSNPYGPA